VRRSSACSPALAFLLLAAVGLVSACGDSQHGDEWAVDAGALKLRVEESPWRLSFYDGDGEVVLREHEGTAGGPTGTAAVHLGGPPEGAGDQPLLPPIERGEPATPPQHDSGWLHATALLDSRYEGETWIGTVATTDPDRSLEVRAAAPGDGVIAITLKPLASADVGAVGISFAAGPNERFVGFGERGDAVDQFGVAVENYVAEGPLQDDEYPLALSLVPKAGLRWRRDTTYFPIPWLLSSRGYGVLIDNDALSYHRVGSESPDAWSMEVEDVELRFRVFAGPTPADALRRYTDAVGRQPADYAPWFFGPWVQSDVDARIDELRREDVPTSVTATYLHYLPCGSQQGREEAQIERTERLHAAGTAVHTYFNPMICVDYRPAFMAAEARGALLRRADGTTYTYSYIGSTVFEVSQFDFTAASGIDAYKTLSDEALAHGYDGWMEDFGEYTPLDAVAADGTTGSAFHNRYPRDYHCGVRAATAGAGKPLARFARSGWTGSAACSPIVWGGDPTTSFGFDGLESSIYQALSIGSSGVGIWGSDIGGFHSFYDRALTVEMLDRWIAFGGLSTVMRSEKDGVALPEKVRPQLWEEANLPTWRRYAKLHTQLYPYILAAAEEYYETGMPVMRHHVLTDPADPRATARDDQYLFGPALLVAPVHEEGAVERSLYLPAGVWIDWWRSLDYRDADGGFTLGAAQLSGGEREVVVAAPQNEIPIQVRAGAVIAMLAPDVFTLADYGDDPSIVHLSDRDGELYLLAFPRGESSGRFFATGSYTSGERDGGWTLALDDERVRTIHLQASLATLERPFAPCDLRVDGEALDPAAWSYDDESGVLRAELVVGRGELRVDGCG
jgi:alpha-glucosidase (family GH31 glycosyl hydrolase)